MNTISSLYLVTNGYLGNGAVGVIVSAYDETEARKEASAALKASNDKQREPYRYPDNYWQPDSLTVEHIEPPFLLEVS